MTLFMAWMIVPNAVKWKQKVKNRKDKNEKTGENKHGRDDGFSSQHCVIKNAIAG